MARTATAAGAGMEAEVLRRYGDAAKAPEASLCCPVQYEREYLEAIPQEVIEKDYGCGDPSRWVRRGERVVDLGSGTGKICFILSQKVGPEGRVTGVDFNGAMLSLARRHAPTVAERTGCDNVRFVKGRIQDLALDLERAQPWLDAHPIRTVEDLSVFEAECERLRRDEPMIPTNSTDVVVSNCVLNLVRPADKDRLFLEIFRVLRPGGRAVISDIVCDEDPPRSILEDPELWSGCISGAFREDRFLTRFIEAGFYGVEILVRGDDPWRVVEGIEFRSMTVQACKMSDEPCRERNQAVIYKGPWRRVCDDDGHEFFRGERMAVCDKTFKLMSDSDGPYAAHVAAVAPHVDVPLDQAAAFEGTVGERRNPRTTKGVDYRATTEASAGECCSKPADDLPCCSGEGKA